MVVESNKFTVKQYYCNYKVGAVFVVFVTILVDVQPFGNCHLVNRGGLLVKSDTAVHA